MSKLVKLLFIRGPHNRDFQRQKIRIFNLYSKVVHLLSQRQSRQEHSTSFVIMRSGFAAAWHGISIVTNVPYVGMVDAIGW